MPAQARCRRRRAPTAPVGLRTCSAASGSLPLRNKTLRAKRGHTGASAGAGGRGQHAADSRLAVPSLPHRVLWQRAAHRWNSRDSEHCPEAGVHCPSFFRVSLFFTLYVLPLMPLVYCPLSTVHEAAGSAVLHRVFCLYSSTFNVIKLFIHFYSSPSSLTAPDPTSSTGGPAEDCRRWRRGAHSCRDTQTGAVKRAKDHGDPSRQWKVKQTIISHSAATRWGSLCNLPRLP